MRKTKAIKIDGKEIIVKELTVKEIKQILDTLEETEQVSVLDMLFEDIPSIAISMSTGISQKEMEEEMTPSEIAVLKDAVAELNPFFVSMIQRLIQAGKKILKDSSSV